jgi:hypothetical protein
MRCQGLRSAAIASSFSSIMMMSATAAWADEPKSAAVTPRQMAHCIIQRIHEDRRGERTESYKEAFKACKQDLAAEADRGAATAMNAANDAEAAR